MVKCQYCGKKFNPAEGAWDDGDCMCAECIARFVEEQDRAEVDKQRKAQAPKKD